MRRFLSTARPRLVLGIETSCDDTAVAIVDSNRQVYARKRYADRDVQRKFGGIVPYLAAQQPFIHECLAEAGLGLSNLDGIAVTNRPGLVIALRAGVLEALRVARRSRLPLAAVHHMRAHALSAMLANSSVKLPFVAVLISGGHCIFAKCCSVDSFELLGTSVCGSPGECLDKIGRELKLDEIAELKDCHIGAGVERLAAHASPRGHLRYLARNPHTPGADTDFGALKSSFLTMLQKADDSLDLADFCASLQFCVTRHLAAKLHAALSHLQATGELDEIRHVISSGGVAANCYIARGLRKVVEFYGRTFYQVPRELCADNGEMIAYTGALMLEANSPDVFPHAKIPDALHCYGREEIGISRRHEIPRPALRLSTVSLHSTAELIIKSYKNSNLL